MKVSKLIHDLHEKLENLEKENVELKSNMELGVDWEYDNDGNHVAYSKDDLNRQITNLRIKQKELEKDFPRDPYAGGPYVMFDGTDYVHMMVPLTTLERPE